MSSTNSHLFLLLTLIIITTVKSQENTTKPIYDCLAETFTPNSTYKTNLDRFFTQIKSQTPITGFFNGSIGTEPDQIHGNALCRGDVTADQCLQCLSTAIPFVQQFCPLRIMGVSREEKCMLYYYNKTITYQQVRNSWLRSAECGDSTVTDLQSFQDSLGPMMDSLMSHAANVSDKMFATGETSYGSSSGKVYGLVQCTRDLSRSECYNCLSVSLGYVSDFCWGYEGASVVTLHCMLRFESYSFFSQSSDDVLPSSSTQPPPPSSLDGGLGDSGSGQGRALKRTEKVVVIMIPLVSAFVCVMAILVLFLRRRQRYIVSVSSNGDEENKQLQARYFNLNMLRIATNNFAEENKLGEGGFGKVYKGVLTDGLEIAVKRLSNKSKQGLVELRNEVVYVAKLQHKNLVRLLGCCLEDKEKLLIYEFLPNLSLDKFLFDASKRVELSWPSRFRIIEGIARGLLYLHEDSRLMIIHRDLKSSNILLDQNMNPKISDFGLAKLFDVEKSQGTTSHIAGTNGYMAPEYAMLGHFSTRSDVYSFGVLVLEIVTGRKIMSFQGSEESANLLSYAWNYWNAEKAMDIVDKNLGDLHYHEQEILRCIHIGLLCVQEEANKRPNMASILLMLNSYSVTLQAPSTPGFFIKENVRTITDSTNDSGSQENKGNMKNNETNEASINFVTITRMEPR